MKGSVLADGHVPAESSASAPLALMVIFITLCII